MGYWQKEETMGLEEKRQIQSERLIETVNRVYKNVPFYHNKMKEMGLEPGDIKGIDDLNKLPFFLPSKLKYLLMYFIYFNSSFLIFLSIFEKKKRLCLHIKTYSFIYFSEFSFIKNIVGILIF